MSQVIDVAEARELPLVLTGDEVTAIQENRRSQIREPVDIRNANNSCIAARCSGQAIVNVLRDGSTTHLEWHDVTSTSKTHVVVAYPYGKPGDRLWVRERFAMKAGSDGGIWYAADFETPDAAARSMGFNWQPALVLPRSHARLILEITDVRVEHLQHIHRRDVQAEGIVCSCCKGYHSRACTCVEMYSRANALLWKTNPRMWVTTFRKVPQAG